MTTSDLDLFRQRFGIEARQRKNGYFNPEKVAQRAVKAQAMRQLRAEQQRIRREAKAASREASAVPAFEVSKVIGTVANSVFTWGR